jgi:hypothetical protein
LDTVQTSPSVCLPVEVDLQDTGLETWSVPGCDLFKSQVCSVRSLLLFVVCY